MASINNLTSKIISDAEEKKALLLNDANSEKDKIVAKKQDEAEKEAKVILDRAQREAATKKERIISGAELTARNEKLAAKQKVISEVFEKSVEALCNISDDDLKNFIVDAVVNSEASGNQNIILNDRSAKVITSDVVEEMNTKLNGKMTVAISPVRGDFKGGFILEKDGIEINNTFEALVGSIKDDLGLEVAQVLFN